MLRCLKRVLCKQVVSILSRKGRCERASIDEVYLDLTEAAKERMMHLPDSKEQVSAEAQKSHVLGNQVSYQILSKALPSFFVVH